MNTPDITTLPPWEQLLKRMLWQQLGEVKNQRILDFGSGEGWTAAHFSLQNDVTAVEPSADMLSRRVPGFSWRQLQGSVELLTAMPDTCFDMILCHNVLEYMVDKASALQEMTRVLKPGGRMSLVKHNRAGRVMQMTVLLNDFDHAHALLDGKSGSSSQFGSIRYYEDADVKRWCPELQVDQLWGMRTFWDLQQNQDCHRDPEWQERMLAMEHRVSTMPEYQPVAFFHHMLLQKRT